MQKLTTTGRTKSDWTSVAEDQIMTFVSLINCQLTAHWIRASLGSNSRRGSCVWFWCQSTSIWTPPWLLEWKTTPSDSLMKLLQRLQTEQSWLRRQSWRLYRTLKMKHIAYDTTSCVLSRCIFTWTVWTAWWKSNMLVGRTESSETHMWTCQRIKNIQQLLSCKSFTNNSHKKSLSNIKLQSRNVGLITVVYSWKETHKVPCKCAQLERQITVEVSLTFFFF